jgi:hypothetical protein
MVDACKNDSGRHIWKKWATKERYSYLVNMVDGRSEWIPSGNYVVAYPAIGDIVALDTVYFDKTYPTKNKGPLVGTTGKVTRCYKNGDVEVDVNGNTFLYGKSCLMIVSRLEDREAAASAATAARKEAEARIAADRKALEAAISAADEALQAEKAAMKAAGQLFTGPNTAPTRVLECLKQRGARRTRYRRYRKRSHRRR